LLVKGIAIDIATAGLSKTRINSWAKPEVKPVAEVASKAFTDRAGINPKCVKFGIDMGEFMR
jgi:hypothetical protein